MHAAGLAGMTWPKAYGGLGLTLREHLAVNKEVGALAMPEMEFRAPGPAVMYRVETTSTLLSNPYLTKSPREYGRW